MCWADEALQYTEHLENNTEGRIYFLKTIEIKDDEADKNY